VSHIRVVNNGIHDCLAFEFLQMLHPLSLYLEDGLQAHIHLSVGGDNRLEEDNRYEDSHQPFLYFGSEAHIRLEPKSEDFLGDFLLRFLLECSTSRDVHLSVSCSLGAF